MPRDVFHKMQQDLMLTTSNRVSTSKLEEYDALKYNNNNTLRTANFFQIVSNSVLIVILMVVLMFMIFVACFLLVTMFKKNTNNRKPPLTTKSKVVKESTSKKFKCGSRMKIFLKTHCLLKFKLGDEQKSKEKLNTKTQHLTVNRALYNFWEWIFRICL